MPLIDRIFLTAVLLIIIGVLSLLPGTAWIVRITPPGAQKTLHVAFYAALAAALVWCLSPALDDSLLLGLLAAGAAAGFGVLMELIQRCSSSRVGSLADVITNSLAALGGALAGLVGMG